MLKKIIYVLLGVGVIGVSLFFLNIININNGTLSKDEARIGLYQKDAQKGWIAFDMESNDTNRTIKSTIIFKKQGEIVLDFSLKEEMKVDSIHYTVKKGEKSYSLSLEGDKKATVTFLVHPKDKIEIVTQKYGSQDRYWGTLETSFIQYIVDLEPYLYYLYLL